MRLFPALAALAATMSFTGALAADARLAGAIAAEHRSANFVARDAARHPQEVLQFAGIKPDAAVVEVSPGGGYWTEILAPYLRGEGKYYAAVPERGVENFRKKLAAAPDVYNQVKVTTFGKGELAPEASADLVLTFRNVHNWMAQGTAEQAFKSFYNALRPGGVLVVEEHRAATDKPQDPKAANGYVREDYAIGLAERAGFKLASRSEVLANPKDTKDWPRGVWTLPPTLAMGEQDRETYVAIGEADNFLLKFVKPER